MTTANINKVSPILAENKTELCPCLPRNPLPTVLHRRAGEDVAMRGFQDRTDVTDAVQLLRNVWLACNTS